MLHKNSIKFTLRAVIIILTFAHIHAAVVHSHSSHLNKERENDGAYSPRDRGHNADTEQHNNEFDHESILGSAKDAEEYDHLPPDEAKRRLKILLKKMDLNKDEQIDRKELKAWILRSFKMLSKEEADEHLEDADDNGDGKVSWAEYLTDSYGSDADDEDSFKLDKENQLLIEDDKTMWKAADFNGDGLLEGDEWVAFSHPEEHPEMLPHILEQTLRDKDVNKDGAIDFQEFIGDRGLDHDQEWLYTEKEKFDQELDLNRDSKLTGNEILSWIVPSNE
ncbi:reticulocalbin-2-like [Photinus pyralis]|nr:reticulocalbin-2-like [Photinus pyralis]XP_031344195.1 reticulocalbin-2-like [Photinus pyralis]